MATTGLKCPSLFFLNDCLIEMQQSLAKLGIELLITIDDAVSVFGHFIKNMAHSTCILAKKPGTIGHMIGISTLNHGLKNTVSPGMNTLNMVSFED